jgi:hypothetical protein
MRLFVLLFAASVAVSAQTSQPPTRPQTKRPANVSANAPVQSTPLVSINVNVGSVPERTSTNHSPEPDGYGSVADWEVVKWTKAATVVAFLLLILGGWQFVTQRRQTIDSLLLTRRQLALTSQELRLTQESMRGRMQLRIRLGAPITPGHPVVFIAEFENIGSADVDMAFTSAIETWNDLPDKPPPNLVVKTIKSVLDNKGRGSTTRLDTNVATEESIAAIRAGGVDPIPWTG